MNYDEFQRFVMQKGEELYRDMPWRQDTRPYYVLVSELMLQQTQVDRVVPKFQAFIQAFPDVAALARASLGDVLQQWSGLGYNRRAKFLHEAAKKIVTDFGGEFPPTIAQLQSLPGVGKNTAGAIASYAFNQPVVFVETNVRTVYFHHFFQGETDVSDAQILAIVEETLNRDNPCVFFWALMDYGSWLKKQGIGLLDKSRHYKKQAPLKGSIREVRGLIIKQLTKGPLTRISLQKRMPHDERFLLALNGLLNEQLVTQHRDIIALAGHRSVRS